MSHVNSRMAARGLAPTGPHLITIAAVSREADRGSIAVRLDDGSRAKLPSSLEAKHPMLNHLENGAQVDKSLWFRVLRDARMEQARVLEQERPRGGADISSWH